MAARGDFLRELRMVLSRLADHVGSDLDPMAVPLVEHARNAFPLAVGDPGVGGRVGWRGRETPMSVTLKFTSLRPSLLPSGPAAPSRSCGGSPNGRADSAPPLPGAPRGRRRSWGRRAMLRASPPRARASR